MYAIACRKTLQVARNINSLKATGICIRGIRRLINLVRGLSVAPSVLQYLLLTSSREVHCIVFVTGFDGLGVKLKGCADHDEKYSNERSFVSRTGLRKIFNGAAYGCCDTCDPPRRMRRFRF